MGEYWFPVNATRKQYVHAHRLGHGLKLTEWSQPGSSVLAVVAKWSLTDKVYLQSDYECVIEVTGAPELGYDDMRDTYTEVSDLPGESSAEMLRAVVEAIAPLIDYECWHEAWAEENASAPESTPVHRV